MTEAGEKPAARWVQVDSESADRRLDNFLLTELKGLPRARIYQMIRKGEVRVNKGRSKPAYRLLEGDSVRIPPVHGTAAAPHKADQQRSSWILEHIVHEDAGLLVLDKPAGLAVHGGSGISLGVIELLRAARPDCHYLELVHRLDRATSGLLLIARKRSVLRALHEQLREGQVDKVYNALLSGHWEGGAQVVDTPLQVDHRQNGERHVRPAADGKPAWSRFAPLEIFPQAVLCRVRIRTGRTHQIRVHAAAIGHPIMGDTRYGLGSGVSLDAGRLCLHAAELRFMHPLAKEEMRLTSALPDSIEKLLPKLRAG